MKKLFVFAAAAICAAALVSSCNKNEIELSVTPQIGARTFTCVIADNGTKLGVSDAGKVTWEVGDEILIHAGKDGNEREVITLTANDIKEDGKVATITTTLPPYVHYDSSTGLQDYKSTYYAIYPASAVKADKNLYYETRINDFSVPAMGGYDNGEGKFIFHNVCGVIKYQVSGDFDSFTFLGNNKETVCYLPDFQYRVAMTIDGDEYFKMKTSNGAECNPQLSQDGTVVADGTTINYICIPAGANFSSGFTIQFKKQGEIKNIVTTEKSINLAMNKLLVLGDITSQLKDYTPPQVSDHKSEITGATDISAQQANCFVITAPGKYKFPAIKGENGDAAGNVFGAEIVWETYNNETEVVPNSIIAAVDFEDNWIYFQTPETLLPGNALIAAKDNAGKIIWSWHIWIPSTTITTIDATTICNAVVMDRNLGALVVAETGGDAVASVESFGLMYQWGRKDPFPGPKRVNSSTLALVSGTQFSLKDQTKEAYVSGDTVKGSMSQTEAIQNPTVFGNYGGGDWDEAKDGNRWTRTGKTINDPCPAGYMVMKRESSSVLWNTTSIKTAAEAAGMTWSASLEGHWMEIKDGNTVLGIPMAGYIDDCDVKNVPYIEYPGKRAAVYAAYLSSGDPYHLNIRLDKWASGDEKYLKAGSTSAARGASVRCVVVPAE